MVRPVIALSSHVVAGTVGNRAARFALECLGFPVLDLPTALLPFHPGRGPGTRIVPDDAAFAALLDDLRRSGLAFEAAGVLTGYFATPAQAEAAARLVDALKAADPAVLYLCDPVLGDGRRLYQPEAVAKAVRDALLPRADILTPNLFELGWLSGAREGLAEAASVELMVDRARTLSRPEVVVTSAPGLMRGRIATLSVTPSGSLMAEHAALPLRAKGTGDLFAGLLLGRRLQGLDREKALLAATAATFDIVAETARRDLPELALIEAQERLVAPLSRPALRRLGAGSPDRRSG